MNPEDFAVVQAMEEYGGSFVQALAELCHRADPYNLRRIKQTWSHYWREYEKVAKGERSI